MIANLDEIAEFVYGQWYSENGRKIYNFQKVDEDYLGNTTVSTIANNESEQSTYLLALENKKVYIIIGDTEYTIEELDSNQFVYQNDKHKQVLVRNL